MKKWKIIKKVTIIVIIVFICYVIFDAIQCLNMEYPQQILGVDVYNWLEQFRVDFMVTMLMFGIPLLIDIILLILSIMKINKLRSNNN